MLYLELAQLARELSSSESKSMLLLTLQLYPCVIVLENSFCPHTNLPHTFGT
jgi:hypothetical protein